MADTFIHPQPIPAGKRTAIVDALRGWALLGVALMNYSDYYFFDRDFKNFHPDKLTNILLALANIIFAAKSWTLLGLLFGYGFAVLIQNVSNKGINPIRFFTIRMLWLLVIAFVNCCFWWGDILKDYALMGLILLCFYKLKPKPAFILAVILFVLLPALQAVVRHIKYDGESHFRQLLPLHHGGFIDNIKFHLLGTYYREMIMPSYAITVHVAMFLCFLLGFGAQRIHFFENLGSNKRMLTKICWYTLTGMVTCYLLAWCTIRFRLTFFRYYELRYPIVLFTMLCIASWLCMLYINRKLKPFFSAMQKMGRMTLTNYMVQNIIAFFVFGGAGLGFGSTLPYWFYLALPLAIYIIQVYLSRWWLEYYNYGPIEWLWRQLSYGKRLKLKG